MPSSEQNGLRSARISSTTLEDLPKAKSTPMRSSLRHREVITSYHEDSHSEHNSDESDAADDNDEDESHFDGNRRSSVAALRLHLDDDETSLSSRCRSRSSRRRYGEDVGDASTTSRLSRASSVRGTLLRLVRVFTTMMTLVSD